MDGERQHTPRPRIAGPAFVVLAVSFVAIASIVALSNDDKPASIRPATSIAVSDTSIATTPTLGVPPPLAPVDITTIASTTVVSTAPPTNVATTLPAATASTTSAQPTINAKAYAIYDTTSRQWLAESNADTPLPVGSIMKLLTAYLALQTGDLAKVVTVPELHLDIAESSIGLYKGEQLPRDVLMRAMLIVSANDAAQTLALDIGGTTENFVKEMNDAAQQLGLTNTVATNPSGLDQGGAHSSARDVITLASTLMQNDTFREAVAKTSAKLHGKTYVSTDKLLTTYPGANGVKTGHTTGAGYCVVSSATRNGRTVMVVVLGAPSEDQRFEGASTLLDWAFAQP
jgi:serine-type D-Ala-D-Ala carboxypeptidase (penicillin-binding protein 5/6)